VNITFIILEDIIPFTPQVIETNCMEIVGESKKNVLIWVLHRVNSEPYYHDIYLSNLYNLLETINQNETTNIMLSHVNKQNDQNQKKRNWIGINKFDVELEVNKWYWAELEFDLTKWNWPHVCPELSFLCRKQSMSCPLNVWKQCATSLSISTFHMK